MNLRLSSTDPDKLEIVSCTIDTARDVPLRFSAEAAADRLFDSLYQPRAWAKVTYRDEFGMLRTVEGEVLSQKTVVEKTEGEELAEFCAAAAAADPNETITLEEAGIPPVQSGGIELRFRPHETIHAIELIPPVDIQEGCTVSFQPLPAKGRRWEKP